MTSDAIPRPHPFSAQPGYHEDGRPDTDTTAPVATPAHPDPEDLEPDRIVNSGATPGRLRVWWAAAVRDGRSLPEAWTEPANLLEIWDYACEAAVTTRTDGGGAIRVANRVWAAVTLPFCALLLTALWALPRPGRLVAFVVTLLLIGTGVARIPVLGWLVPPVLDVLDTRAW